MRKLLDTNLVEVTLKLPKWAVVQIKENLLDGIRADKRNLQNGPTKEA